VSRQGFSYLLLFLAVISVNLAVLNFLPIPILDGGQFVFLLIEKIKGSPVHPRIQDLATIVGLVVIGGIFILVTFNDVRNLLGGVF
jgi:regulator of sigma E protease